MSATVTPRSLFDSLHTRLELEWVAGAGGAEVGIRAPKPGETGPALVGHLNFVHPNRIQIVGVWELKHLHGLKAQDHAEAIKTLFSEDTAAVVVCDDQPVPEAFVSAAESQDTPLFCSPLASGHVIADLQYHLTNTLAKKTIIHGVFMEVMGAGVLITGETSIGKSELALELITRGHRLIADDAPEFARIAPDIVNGTCPSSLREFLEVRGLGVVNIRAMFGDAAIKNNKYLRLIIQLETMDSEQLAQIDRLQGSRETRNVLGVEIPQICLPVAPGRNLAVLVEIAVRNHMLRLKGYEAHEDFIKRQRRIMGSDDS